MEIDGRFVLVTGENGAGKTSLLEALHYSCYLKSFRTHLNRDLVNLDNKHFFIEVDYDLSRKGDLDQIQIGYSEQDGKVVKFNKKPITSYKEIIDQYSLVSMTADDLQLISGAPSFRRDFLNYSLFLMDPDIMQGFKRYRQIVDQRNALLQSIGARQGSQYFQDQLTIWTEKLWTESKVIAERRISFLSNLEKIANNFFAKFIEKDSRPIKLAYLPKNKSFFEANQYDDFFQDYTRRNLLQSEIKFRRSLIGCHLDDFDVIYEDKKARTFASRGQQKMLTFLIKVAQIKLLEMNGKREVLLLDDFLTDFDEIRAEKCMKMLLSLDLQIFITVPTKKVTHLTQFMPASYCKISL